MLQCDRPTFINYKLPTCEKSQILHAMELVKDYYLHAPSFAKHDNGNVILITFKQESIIEVVHAFSNNSKKPNQEPLNANYSVSFFLLFL